MDHELLPAVRTATLPEKYKAAKIALAKCERIDECKNWADKTKAIASYARQSKDKAMEHMAMSIRNRAVKRCGELLEQVEKASGAHRKSNRTSTFSRADAARGAGLSKAEAVTALRVARVNGDLFEKLTDPEDGRKPATVSQLAELGTKKPEVPIYEKLGMTEKAYKAGMYFRGELKRYIEATQEYSAEDVASGSTAEQRETIKRNLKLVASYNEKLLKQV